MVRTYHFFQETYRNNSIKGVSFCLFQTNIVYCGNMRWFLLLLFFFWLLNITYNGNYQETEIFSWFLKTIIYLVMILQRFGLGNCTVVLLQFHKKKKELRSQYTSFEDIKSLSSFQTSVWNVIWQMTIKN